MKKKPVGSVISTEIARFGQELGFRRLATLIDSSRSATGHASESFLRDIAYDPGLLISDEYRSALSVGIDRARSRFRHEVNAIEDETGAYDQVNDEGFDNDELTVVSINVEVGFSDGTFLRGPLDQVARTLELARS